MTTMIVEIPLIIVIEDIDNFRRLDKTQAFFLEIAK